MTLSTAVQARPLQRHQLAWLQDAAWAEILAAPHWDANARACLLHWQRHGLPLVVARQPPTAPHAGAARQRLQLGLAMPNQWGRGRLGIAVPWCGIRRWGEFPTMGEVQALLPRRCQMRWHRLHRQLQGETCGARIYGSYGWQWLTGLAYLRAHSDVDVLLAVRDVAHADRVAACLEAWPGDVGDGPRIDGELVFPDHDAVPWREWLPWRSGRARAILVKRIDGVALCDSFPGAGATACHASTPTGA